MDRLLTTIGRLFIAVFWLIGGCLVVMGMSSIITKTTGINWLSDFALVGNIRDVVNAVIGGLVLGIGMHLLMKWIWIKK